MTVGCNAFGAKRIAVRKIRCRARDAETLLAEAPAPSHSILSLGSERCRAGATDDLNPSQRGSQSTKTFGSEIMQLPHVFCQMHFRSDRPHSSLCSKSCGQEALRSLQLP